MCVPKTHIYTQNNSVLMIMCGNITISTRHQSAILSHAQATVADKFGFKDI